MQYTKTDILLGKEENTQSKEKVLEENPVANMRGEGNRKDRSRVAIAGMGAGMLSAMVTCPLDVAKTRLQYQAVLVERGMVPYTGTLNALKRIALEEGVSRGLYRGLSPLLLGYIPTWALYFSSYEYLKSIDAGNIPSALISGTLSTVSTNPLWVLKARFMTQNKYTEYNYSGIISAFKHIYKNEGMKGFYKGMGVSLFGVAHVVIQFPTYEYLKSVLLVGGDVGSSDKNVFTVLFASASSKIIASTITYPHEVIRTRLQNQTVPPYRYHGIIDTATKVLANEGIFGFYRGLGTNMLRTVPASMVTLLSFELLIHYL